MAKNCSECSNQLKNGEIYLDDQGNCLCWGCWAEGEAEKVRAAFAETFLPPETVRDLEEAYLEESDRTAFNKDVKTLESEFVVVWEDGPPFFTGAATPEELEKALREEVPFQDVYHNGKQMKVVRIPKDDYIRVQGDVITIVGDPWGEDQW